jgi:fermentation-respiration switch protein FrsA (DUF1100 family)
LPAPGQNGESRLSGVDFVLAAYAAYVAASAQLFAPSVQYTDVLSPQLASEMPAAKQPCLIDLAVHLWSLHATPERILNPSGASNPPLRRFFAAAEPAKRRSAGPILLLQGDRDDQILARATTLLFGELCRLGDVVQYRTYATADHDTILTQAYPAMVQWLRDRLRGNPGKQSCSAPLGPGLRRRVLPAEPGRWGKESQVLILMLSS